jgi:histidyl-tRNA synthetase
MGLERLVELLEAAAGPTPRPLDAYLVAVGERAQGEAIALAEGLRDLAPGLRLLVHCGGGSFKSQFKRADKSGARYALVIGDGELERGVLGVKPLREDSPQQDLSLERTAALLGAPPAPS